MFPLTEQQLKSAMSKLDIQDLAGATIRQIVSLSQELERLGGEPYVHLEIGQPGLPAEHIGIDAECAALHNPAVANRYPAIQGLPALKEAGSRFVRAFLGIDVPGRCIIPTVGSMQASFTLMTLLRLRQPGRDAMLFIDPGFPAQHHIANLLDMPIRRFDLYNYRGAKMEAKLRELLRDGRVTGILYSNPNNPAWTNLTDEELEIIGRLATEYDAIVLEDLAYMGMDFRTDFSHPGEAPYVPTVARYTDNYICLISASKIFSYAGQRIAIACMSPAVYDRRYAALKKRFNMPAFGDAYIYGVLYCASSGTSHAAQYAMAAMLDAASQGTLPYIEHAREYRRRAEQVCQMLADNGFQIVYDRDADDRPICEGFFFTAGYPGLTGEQLQRELMRYGISSIPLSATYSDQQGIRICVSALTSPEHFERMRQRLTDFHNNHKDK